MTQGPARAALFRRRSSIDASALRAAARELGLRTTELDDLDQVLTAARAGEIGAVVVADLGELGRYARELRQVLGELVDCGVRVIAVEQELDLKAGATARLALAVVDTCARLDSERRGARYGRKGPAPKSGRPDPDKIAALRARGKSWREIADELGVPYSMAYRTGTDAARPNESDGRDTRGDQPARSRRKTTHR